MREREREKGEREKLGEREQKSSKDELFHVIHKVPPGDTPYVRAKYAQLIEKDPESAISLFWEAINAGDRVESALKDMAVVMKQVDRAEEAIDILKTYRFLCSKHSQESLDNVLIDLFKKCGRIEEQIEVVKRKLRKIYEGEGFNGKPTRTARSHGKKFQVSVKQETSRLLGNLGWAYMQKPNYMMAEAVYKKAQIIDPDANKACNLGLCLMKQGRLNEAISVLQQVQQGKIPGSDETKAQKRAGDLLTQIRSRQSLPDSIELLGLSIDGDLLNGLEQLVHERGPFRSKRLPVFEEISSFRDQLACN
ncbi:protein SULFUR DEFICIENCY-INDUCED 1-like [Cucurbita pepo subsp. pepo]|uniref:protein SULFUR DEFICIENCY-INDUCED 1-like n=1 Tax=Cucurbita pepo subsp. pepo TaxID=3664 RepID=UPI000C9D6959|nr:protein SULFUR DEFICIENCY-INDUCED 1-like [Cucurbita pepo subsp. pepo]